MPLQMFVDTSAFYALVDDRDQWHSRAQVLAAQLATDGVPLLTTTHVLAEAYGMVLARTARSRAWAFLQNVRKDPLTVIFPDEQDIRRAENILAQYDDQDFSYVDAVSFAVIERLRIRRAFAYDNHFAVFRPSAGPLVLNR